MRIIHVTTCVFPDRHGGAERFVRGVAAAQAAAGHEVTVLACDQGCKRNEELTDQFRLLRYPVHEIHGWRFYQDVSRSVRTTLRRLSGEKFDILHAHQIASAPTALSTPFPARRVLSFHASYRLEFEAEQLNGVPEGETHGLGFKDRIKSMAIGMLDRRCISRAERIVVHTAFVRDQVKRLDASAMDRVRTVPPGIDFVRFTPGDRVAARERFGFSSDVPLIVTVRRLTRRMGIDDLLHAIHGLKARGIVSALAIAGDGLERGALESLRDQLGLRENVRFMGRVPDEHLPDLLRSADLFVLPTRSMEGFGMATVEALSCGIPVVATDVGANREVVDGLDPEMLANSDPDSLARAIEVLIRDPERRARLGARSAEMVRSRYSWESCVAALDRVYAELTGPA